MRFSVRRISLSCGIISFLIFLDILHRGLQREIQHSDARVVQRRDVSPGTVGHQLCNGNDSISCQTTNKTASTDRAIIHENDTLRSTTLEDVFISVKTTKKYHKSRVSLQVGTWFRLAPQQVN